MKRTRSSAQIPNWEEKKIFGMKTQKVKTRFRTMRFIRTVIRWHLLSAWYSWTIRIGRYRLCLCSFRIANDWHRRTRYIQNNIIYKNIRILLNFHLMFLPPLFFDSLSLCSHHKTSRWTVFFRVLFSSHYFVIYKHYEMISSAIPLFMAMSRCGNLCHFKLNVKIVRDLK